MAANLYAHECQLAHDGDDHAVHLAASRSLSLPGSDCAVEVESEAVDHDCYELQ